MILRFLFITAASIIVITAIAPLNAAPVSLSPPFTSLGYAGRDGELVYSLSLRDADFGDGVRIPVRFTFRSNDNSISEMGWDGWRCGALESRFVASLDDKSVLDLLCNKRMFFTVKEKATQVINGENVEYAKKLENNSAEWTAVQDMDNEEITVSRWDG